MKDVLLCLRARTVDDLRVFQAEPLLIEIDHLFQSGYDLGQITWIRLTADVDPERVATLAFAALEQ